MPHTRISSSVYIPISKRLDGPQSMTSQKPESASRESGLHELRRPHCVLAEAAIPGHKKQESKPTNQEPTTQNREDTHTHTDKKSRRRNQQTPNKRDKDQSKERSPGHPCRKGAFLETHELGKTLGAHGGPYCRGRSHNQNYGPMFVIQPSFHMLQIYLKTTLAHSHAMSRGHLFPALGTGRAAGNRK